MSYRNVISAAAAFFIIMAPAVSKVRIAVDGLTHQHVVGLFKYLESGEPELELVAIAESDERAIERYVSEYSIDRNIIYPDLETLLSHERVDGVLAFNSISGHYGTIAACAERGIDVMVEKPLALNYREALSIRDLAQKSGITVLVNYETSWYPSIMKIKRTLETDHSLGPVRKILVNTGHCGPEEINVTEEFLEWLRDPAQNGGGAVIDFGCYGANLSTWIMDGKRPLSVTAVLKTNKPETYPEVDDEAMVILTYDKAQAVIQGSWNWPFNRKDIEVYCVRAYMKAYDNFSYAERRNGAKEICETLEEKDANYSNAFDFFADMVSGKAEYDPSSLSSLENNITVMEILDAAVRSSESGKTVFMK